MDVADGERRKPRRHALSFLGLPTSVSVLGAFALAVPLLMLVTGPGPANHTDGQGAGKPESVGTPTAAAGLSAGQPRPPSGSIESIDGHLVLDGHPYAFTGLNAYELATDWGVNEGCGPMVSDAQLDELFASLPPGSLVRFWAFQGSMATNIDTHQLDWSPLDRVFAAAAAHGQRLIVVLTDQSGSCDDGLWKDPAWYQGGYNDVHDASGLTPLSYSSYVNAIVERYRSSPALGMWEPISEPEASTCPAADQPDNCNGNQVCPDEAGAALALRSFFDTVGAQIHALDPPHLVEDGLIGSGQCGASAGDYNTVSASPGIDVLSYHDYSAPTNTLPGDQWNGLTVRLQEAAQLGKPIIGGEVGIVAGSGNGCLSDAQRAPLMLTKMEAQMEAGSSGVLAWDWLPSATLPCNWDITPGDPLIADLANVPLDER